MNILYLTTCLPSKKGTGGDIASEHFINALKCNQHRVLVVGYQRKGVPCEPKIDIMSVGERYIETKEAKLYPVIWGFNSLIKNLPYSSAKYYSQTYLKKVNNILNDENYDVIILEHSSQLVWLKSIISERYKLIINAQNIENEVYLERIEYTNNSLLRWIYQREIKLAKKAEDELARIAKQTWTLTQHDAEYFIKVVGIENQGKIKRFDLPSSLENLGSSLRKPSFDIGMIGSWTWKPNRDGLKWFFQWVYPHLPDTLSIHIAGRGAEWLQGLYPNVNYRGFVPDARDFMAEAKVIAIPGIRGAGVQIKTLDAVGVGLPIVATPFALRGISNPPTTVQVAEDPEQFAQCLMSVVSSPLVQNGQEQAVNWAEQRRVQFISDVAAAVDEFR